LDTIESAADLAWKVQQLRDGLVYAMLVATALSGLQYLWRAGLLLQTPADV
jgi:hypothetical protein